MLVFRCVEGDLIEEVFEFELFKKVVGVIFVDVRDGGIFVNENIVDFFEFR